MSGLSFFNPYYLWALFFLLIPIIIHLIRRRRIVKLDFSSLRFLKDTAVKANRIRRLKNILQLLNRLLMVILLILIFAQPFNKMDPFRIISGSNTVLYSWIDPTISMGYKREGISLWQEAYAMASVFDTVLHSSAKYCRYDGRVDDFIDIHHTEMSEEKQERFAPLRYGPTDIENMIQVFQNYRKNDLRTPVLVLFSDFQKKDKEVYEEFFTASEISYPVICVSLADEHPWNYSVTNTRISVETIPTLKCSVKARGKGLRSGEVIALIQSMRAGQKTVQLKRNDSIAVSLAVSHHNVESRGEVQLVANDPFAYDNTSHFVERKFEKQRILVISEGDDSFPIVSAFRSLSSSRWHIPSVKSPADVSFDDLDSSDIIVLSSIREPTSVLATLWGRSALSRKLIIFAPYIGDKPGGLNSIILQHLKAAKDLRKIQTPKAFFPVLPDTVSSLWQGFPRFTDRDVAVYECVTPIPGSVLVRLNKGMSLVSHCSDSSGYSWIVFSTPIGISEANNLCETGFFIPLLDRVVRYGSELVKKKPTVWVAGKRVHNPYSGTRSSAQVFNSDNKQIALWDRQPQVVLEMPGLFKVQPRGEPVYWIAAVVDSSEGDCRYQKPKVAAKNIKNVKFLNRSSFIHFIQDLNYPMYDFLWLLFALSMIVEVLLWKKRME